MFLVLGGSASAQITGGFKSPTAPAPANNFSTFLGQTMAKPDFSSAMSQKPGMPIAPNPAGAFPTFQLQNLMLLRNMFGPSVTVTMPKTQVPPPKTTSP